MWGIYYFAGGWLGSLCLITFLALLLKKGGMLEHEVTREHIQDMGKFIFGFVVFWTYIAFSQYMLYWYGNLPEETLFFHRRAFEDYALVTQSLVWFHFVIPFIVLLPRFSKRFYPLLATMAVWLLVMHWIDLWWITIPSMYPPDYGYAEAAAMLSGDGAQTVLTALQASGEPTALDPDAIPAGTLDYNLAKYMVPAAFKMVDVLCGLGFALLLVGGTLLRATRHALTPYNDPYFNDSLRFENV
jgi:hypothetical protein